MTVWPGPKYGDRVPSKDGGFCWGHHKESCLCPHWVYVLEDAEGFALYVGCTTNFAGRMRSHFTKPWYGAVAATRLRAVVGKAAALDLERQLTDQLKPVHDRSWVVRNQWGRGGVKRAALEERSAMPAQGGTAA